MDSIDARRCEDLCARVLGGDDDALRLLIEHLCPHWLRMLRSRPALAALGGHEDHVEAVMAALVAKIGRPRGRGLLRYPPWRQAHPDKDFADWIRIVTANAARDYVRAHQGGSAAEPGVKRLLNEWSRSPLIDRLGIRPPITAAQTARQLLEFARAELPAEQWRALELWLEGSDFVEMGRRLALEPDAARRLVRAAVATIRRQFA